MSPQSKETDLQKNFKNANGILENDSDIAKCERWCCSLCILYSWLPCL